MNQRRDESKLGGAQAWAVWALSVAFVTWLFAIQTGYAIVSLDIQRDVGLSLAEVGLAASTYSWALAGVQFSSGALLDRFGLRPLMTIAVALVTAGAFLYSATTSFASLLLAQVVLALGASFGFVGAGFAGGKWFEPAKYGLMFGLVQTVASLGSAVAQPVISQMLKYVNWHQLLAGFGMLGVLLVIAFAAVVQDPKPRIAQPKQPSLIIGIISSLGSCFSNRQVLLSALFGGVSFGSLLAVGVLWGPRVTEARGAGPGFSALVVAMAWVGLALGAPLFNVVSNRWHSRKRPAATGLALQLIALCIFIYGPVDAPGASLVVMLAFGLFSGAQMLGFTVAGESVPTRLIGSASSVVNGFCYIIGGILAAVPGWLLISNPSLSDYQHALIGIPIALAVGVVATLLLRDYRTPVPQ